MNKRTIIRAGIFAAIIALAGSAAEASNVFRADTADNLNVATAWSNSVAPTSSDVATWNNIVQVNTTSTMGADLSWAGIQILDPASMITINSGNTLTLGASGIDLSQATNGLTLDNAIILGGAQTWAVTNGMTLTVAGTVSGTGPLTLNTGANTGGAILLNVANTYTGGTVINGGIIEPNNATSFGPSSSGVTNNGNVLLFASLPNGGIIASTMKINGTVLLDMNNRNTSVVLDGAFSGTGTLLVTNDTASGSTLTLGGNGSGGGNFTGFTGSLIVATNASATPSAGNIRFNNGGGNNNLGNVGMTLDLGSGSTHFTEKNSGTATSFGALSGGPNTQLASSENYSIGALGLDTTFAGTIMGSSSLTKNGTGVLTLTGNNPYTGATTVNAGVLEIGDGVTAGTGSLGAGNVTLNVNGTLWFNKPDAFAVNNNISGAGTLVLSNATTTLTYGGTDTGSGPRIVAQGILAVGSSATIAAPISLAAGTTFDVTGNPSFSLGSTLSGFGTVAGPLSASSGGLAPGASGAAGTLTFSAGLTELNNVNNQFSLSSPGSTNDLIAVTGDLTVSGANNVSLTHFGGGAIPVGVYPLITYSGNLNGSVTNFSVTAFGVTATLTNPPGQIAVIIAPPARLAMNLAWTGDGAANNWDMTSSNWVNGATRFSFQAGDTVTFDDSGATNPFVTIAVTVEPAAVIVNSQSNYVFAGNFGITGATGLVKTNSGTLSISATNNFTGPVIVGAGTLEVSNIAISGSASAIGAASGNPTNLVFYGSTFRYSGDNASSDRGATLNGSGVTIDVPAANLALNGVIAGTGALAKIGAGTLTLGSANTYSGGTIVSNGTLATANDAANTGGFGPTSSPVTLAGGTLALYRNNGDDGSTVFSFFNPLIVPAGQMGNLNLFERGNAASALSGGGILNISSAGQRTGLTGNGAAFTGNINITGNIRIGNPYGYSNAVINLTDNSDLDGGNAGGTYSSNPTFDIGELDGTSLAFMGTASKPSPNPTWRIGWKNTTSTFAGTIQNPASGSNSIVKVGTGSLILSGYNLYTGSTTVSAGTLVLTGAGSIASSANLDVQAGAQVDVSSLSPATLYVGPSQTLSGLGTINGGVDNSSGGIISPGEVSALGTLHVTGAANLAGTAWMFVNRAGTPMASTLVAPAINLGGTLVVTNVGPRLQAGDSFTLFSGTLTGAFGTLILPGYYTWDTSHLAANGSVTVTGVLPPPAVTNVDFSAFASGTITLNAANGMPNGPVNVLTTTNLALPSSSWTTVINTSFDANGNLTIPVTVDPSLPQSYFELQAY
jgi:fibronectin-binding autotransporter adhesin